MTPPDGQQTTDWGEYRRLILAELERLSSRIELVDSKIDEVRRKDLASMSTDLELLKFKASLWGGLMGAIGGVLAGIAAWLLHVR